MPRSNEMHSWYLLWCRPQVLLPWARLNHYCGGGVWLHDIQARRNTILFSYCAGCVLSFGKADWSHATFYSNVLPIVSPLELVSRRLLYTCILCWSFIFRRTAIQVNLFRLSSQPIHYFLHTIIHSSESINLLDSLSSLHKMVKDLELNLLTGLRLWYGVRSGLH